MATLLATTATPALAGTIVVDSTTDDGAGCTLREAVAVAQTAADANDCTGATAGGNVVRLPAATHNVTTAGGGAIPIAGPVTIEGAGTAQTIVSGGGQTRVFDITSPESVVVLRDLTIMAGKAPDGAQGTSASPMGGDGEPGGGLRNAGTLTLEHVTMSGNRGGNGGVGYNAAGSRSMFPRGTSDSLGGDGGAGGAIHNTGALRLVASTIQANTAGTGGAGVRQMMGMNGESGYGGDGGGIANAGTLEADAASVFANNAAGAGGTGDPTSATNVGSPVPSGTGGQGGHGGAVATIGSGTTTLTGTRITANAAGAGGDGGFCAQAIESSDGGIGGSGGGVYAGGSGQTTLIGVLVEANRAGNGGSGNTGSSDTAIGGDGGPGGSGGGVATSPGGRLVVSGSTLDQNTAGAPGAFGTGGGSNPVPGQPSVAGNGGGAFVPATGALSLQATVVARNSAGRRTNGAPAIGRGDAVFAAGNAGIVGTTLIANVPADGVAGGTGIDSVLGSSLALTASLTSSNGGAECSGDVFNGGGNLSFGTAPCPAASNADPQLPALGGPGDPVPLLLPPATSPALDLAATGTGACGGLDQRGAERPQGAACDAGAVERLGNAESAATGLTQVSATIAGRANSEADGTVQLYAGPNAESLTRVGDPLPVTGGAVTPVVPTAQLTGLAPGTTYAIQARIDGPVPQAGPIRTFTTLGPDPTPTATPAVTATPAPAVPVLKLGRLKATSKALTARLTCTGAPCLVRLDAATRLRKKGKRVTGVTLTTRRTKAFRVAKPATRTLKAGQQVTVKLALTKSARKLLTRFHKLPVRVTVTLAGKRVTTAKITAKPPKPKKRKRKG